jgi:site-specific DNA-methyltransferase (adenine-specific)
MKVRKGEYAQSSNYGKSGGVRYKEPEPFYPTTLLTFSNSDQKSKIHPTQKPIDLAQYIVRTYTDEGDLVVDPFLGSGTCAEACLTEKRVFKGSEKNEQFYKAAKSRIDSLVVTMEVNDESEPVELPEAQKPTTRKRKTSSTNKEQAAAAAPKTAKRRKQT